MYQKIEAALLIVKGKVNNEVIFILEVRDHVIIKVDQQSFLGPLQDILNHVSGNVVLLGNLKEKRNCNAIVG